MNEKTSKQHYSAGKESETLSDEDRRLQAQVQMHFPQLSKMMGDGLHKMTRRDCLLMLLAHGAIASSVAALTSCVAPSSQYALNRPDPSWPNSNYSTHPMGKAAVTPKVKPQTPDLDMSSIIARKYWSKGSPVYSRINAMNGVRKITVHHEGASPVHFTDWQSTARRMESIRKGHLGRKWADIGYHYVVDRAGRVWQGRSVASQGAHVRDHNSNNLGVMVLGNFEKQTPSDIQLASLQRLLRQLRKQYRLPAKYVYTHREFVATACPGKNLQPRINRIRELI